MSTVKNILDEKGRNVWTTDQDSTVFDAVSLMAEKNVGALVVTSSESTLAGILSERDYARKVILKDKASKSTKVSEIMTADVVFAKEDTLLDRCMAMMTQRKIRHLPIINNQGPVGMITLGDIMKTIIKEQSSTIEEMESVMYEDQGGEG
ncbi:MAG: CBS domain-containing protein [Pseudomonadales bacterium]|nr:CBS domain-containing protein [Pseudomonadales bacterium]MBO6565867.1 CBS domain-containing protein [Pseudomonadales bacterium]MBO6595466.1 CBS domain-containing protein [Pseudomonadales bacterium]MBO6820975.1 CBS domain-containing protein [Pseudomonadales bacterium]